MSARWRLHGSSLHEERGEPDASANVGPAARHGTSLTLGEEKMIRIRHSHPEYEVAGSPAELRFVAERLTRLATVGDEEIIACDSAFDPKPYAAVLPRLRLLKKEGKDTVSASP